VRSTAAMGVDPVLKSTFWFWPISTNFDRSKSTPTKYNTPVTHARKPRSRTSFWSRYRELTMKRVRLVLSPPSISTNSLSENGAFAHA
jgi:hypothetical protein